MATPVPMATDKGCVTFDDFVELMLCLRQFQSDEDELREAFKIFDSDCDGVIDAEDIQRTMVQLGEEVSLEDAKEMVEEADMDGDGKINFKGENKFILKVWQRDNQKQ